MIRVESIQSFAVLDSSCVVPTIPLLLKNSKLKGSVIFTLSKINLPFVNNTNSNEITWAIACLNVMYPDQSPFAPICF